MNKAIISLKDSEAVTIVKEAKKKAIDKNISFSEAVLKLLDKWVSDSVSIEKGNKK